MDFAEMKKKFDESITAVLSSKRMDNSAYLSEHEYQKKIADVKSADEALKTSGMKKSVRDYRLVRKYGILNLNGNEKLIKPVENASENILYYVKNEELFDVLHSTHSSVGHGGRDRMLNELKKKYCNITKETMMVYLHLCIPCQKKLYYRRGD